MNKIHAITVLSIAILASSSGVRQVEAANYFFFVDFSTKEVANYTAYRQTFNEDTINLTLNYNFGFEGVYYFDSCPTAFNLDMDWRLNTRKSLGPLLVIKTEALPDFPCTTIPTFYQATITGTLDSTYLDQVVNDDSLFLKLESNMIFRHAPATSGRTLYLENYSFYFDLTYDFGTTYLFNYFLSDQKYLERQILGSWTFYGLQTNRLNYVYTTAGNDRYQISNSDFNTIGTTRKKYAVDYNGEFFRGNSVGAGFLTFIQSIDPDELILGASGASILTHITEYYYLNVANLAQPIVNVPLINFTTQTCSGGFLDINVGCFINNALAYLTNTAPIISDATQLINAGISFAGQTFGVIGAFTTNNMFGYLVLGGFGFIVIKSLFKNDK